MTFRSFDGSHAVPLAITDMRPEATVGDLARSLRPEHGGGATCSADGVEVPATTLLVDWPVPRGATVCVVPDRPSDPSAAAVVSAVVTPRPPFRATVVAGLDASASITLDRPHTRIGRAADNDLVLTDPTVSDRHCSVLSDDTQPMVLVTDEASTNGTWLGGTACGTAARVTAGTRLRLGASFVEISDTPPPRAVALRVRRSNHRTHCRLPCRTCDWESPGFSPLR